MLSSLLSFNTLWLLLIGFLPFFISLYKSKSFPKHRRMKLLKWNSIATVGYLILGSIPFVGNLFSFFWIVLLLWALFPKWMIFKPLN